MVFQVQMNLKPDWLLWRVLMISVKPLVVQVSAQSYLNENQWSFIIKYKQKYSSPTGNWTPVSRVTGGDTDHYTIEELLIIWGSKIKFETRQVRWKIVSFFKITILVFWQFKLSSKIKKELHMQQYASSLCLHIFLRGENV
jgi:hypothetical protein